METFGTRVDPQGLVQVPGATFADLALDSIHPNRKQPRVEFNEDELGELVHSIREIGVLQPIVVRPSQEAGDATYELVMGERRWRASREAGLETIPAIIRSTLDDDLLRDALLENLHRSALNPLEEAAAYQQLLDDFGCSHDELAGRLGRSRPQISNTLRLMKLPPLVQRRLAAGVLSAGHARALLGLEDAAEMEKLAQRIVAEGLSVRSTEEIVALSGGLRQASKPTTPRDGARHERLDYLATSLSDRLDTNVKITLGAKKGRVSIEFASVDDLNRIVSVLSPNAD
ncbi:ParB/RepB/Spo0J family partition protein [Vibrio cholerae]|nr:ParB/RepB/Spo0J family partition protein [Vibrio cholerae]